MPDDAQIGRFPRNPFLVPSDSTLADVLALIEGDGSMLPTRRRDLSSAIRRACDLLGRAPAMIPASVAELKRGLTQVNAAAMGCSPKTLQNIKSGLLAALRHTGVAIAPNTQHTRLSPRWRCLRDTLPDQQYRAGLSRLMHFCAAQGIDPGDVDDAVVSVFMLAETSCCHPRSGGDFPHIPWSRLRSARALSDFFSRKFVGPPASTGDATVRDVWGGFRLKACV